MNPFTDDAPVMRDNLVYVLYMFNCVVWALSLKSLGIPWFIAFPMMAFHAFGIAHLLNWVYVLGAQWRSSRSDRRV